VATAASADTPPVPLVPPVLVCPAVDYIIVGGNWTAGLWRYVEP
jgi:hypothetical protein